MPIAGKTGVYEQNPNTKSVLFAGEYISLSAIAREVNLSPAQVSRIFSGVREPSLRTARLMSLALGMGLDEFTSNLCRHIETCHKAEALVA